MLIRKGIFTRLNTEGFGVDGHSLDYIRLWRRVLDEQLLALIGSDKEEAVKAYEWFNSKDGDVSYYIDDDTGMEVKVNTRDEFEECCILAGIESSVVTEVANKVLSKVKQEDRNNKHAKVHV
jgi:hypothetical protein